MMEPFRWSPPGDETVTFVLKPLDMAGLYRIQSALATSDVPNWECAEAIVSRHLIGWEGLEQPFSERARREMLAGAASVRWIAWIGAIVGELYRRAVLTAEEKKT